MLFSPEIEDHIDILTGDQLAERDSRWSRLEKLRRWREGEEGQESPLNVTCSTPADSRESSVEGIYLSGVKNSHPFKVVECDTRSVQSDSKSVRNDSHRSSVSDVRQPQPPDIVMSSSKPSAPSVPTPPVVSPINPPVSVMGPPPQPLAPPRKKKPSSSSINHDQDSVVLLKPKPTSLAVESCSDHSNLPSPASTVANLTKDLDLQLLRCPSSSSASKDDSNSSVQNLNISSAVRGEFVVKPHDDESRRGEQERKVSINESSPVNNINQDPAASPGVQESLVNTSVASGRGSLGGSLGASRRKDGYTSGGSGSYNSGGSGGYHSSRSGAAVSGGSSDSGMMKQLNLFVRTKSDSGNRLTDQEILRQIKVKNLDTGTEMDLAAAEDMVPASINPLSLHIMRLTSEYTGTLSSDVRSLDSDTESIDSRLSEFEIGQAKKKGSISKIVGNLGKMAKTSAKKLTDEIQDKIHKSKEEKQEEKLGRLATDITNTDGVKIVGNTANDQGFKRIQAHKSGPTDFQNIQFGQDLSGHHQGPIWGMKFSLCGRLLATAGQDCILRIWVLKDKYQFFYDMRRRYQMENDLLPSPGELEEQEMMIREYMEDSESEGHLFMDRPFVTYTGHTSDLLDVSWSKNYFILTSSMDKTVRLWHISRLECLCIFQHIDFVTAIVFHPKNDQFFISGSLDGKIRLWNIPDKKVRLMFLTQNKYLFRLLFGMKCQDQVNSSPRQLIVKMVINHEFQ